MFERKKLRPVILVLAAALCVFQLLTSLGVLLLNPLVVRSVHVGLILPLIFLWRSPNRALRKNPRPEALPVLLWDLLLVAISAAACAYIAWNEPMLAERMPQIDEVTPLQIILGAGLVFCILEATRRLSGWALVIYLVLHFLEVILDSLFSVLAQGFLTGVAGSYSGALEWLSPTVYLENTVWIDRVVEERLVNQDPYSSYYDYVTTEIHLRGLWIVGVYVLVGVALLGLTYLLYRRRRSESAGDVVAAPWLRPVFRVVVTLLAALPGGMALYEIFWRSFQYSPYYQALPMAVCMCVAGLIGWYAAAMLLAKSLRVFRGSWKGTVAVMVCCAAVCAAMHTDVLGVAARVPNAEDVSRIELRVAGNSYTLDAGKEDALIAQVVELHRAVVQDLDYLREKEAELYNQAILQEDAERLGETTTWLWLKYTLANGQHLMRSYELFLTRERMAQAGTYDYLLDALVNGEAMKAVRLHDGDPDYTLTGGYVSTDLGGSYDLGSREAEAIAAAVRRDAANGTWGTYEWFDSSDAHDYAINMELTFEYQEQDSSGTSYTSTDWITIRVRPEMTETVDCLLRLGLVTKADLVTRAELYPEDYGYDAVQGEGDGAVLADENTSVAVVG